MEQDNILIMSDKPPEKFVYSILLMFEKFEEIIISTREGYMDKVERIVRLFSNLGIEEIERNHTTADHDDKTIDVVTVKLRNPNRM